MFNHIKHKAFCFFKETNCNIAPYRLHLLNRNTNFTKSLELTL